MDRLIGLLGIAVLLGFAYLLSNDRSKISPRLVATGLGMQFVIGFVLLRDGRGADLISVLAEKVVTFLNLSYKGSGFLFGKLADHSFTDQFGFQFAFGVLSMIIFFSAFMAAMYYLGVMQKLIRVLAKVMQKIMGTSGAETLSCTANVFVGQTEAPLLVRPFIAGLTKSELLTIMIGGFATIAGSVFGAYVALGANPSYLIIGSCMAVPGALMMGKILYPETEQAQTSGEIDVPTFDTGSNLLEAVAKGTGDGLKLAVNVGAMLIAFIALIGFVDMVLATYDLMLDGSIMIGSLKYGVQLIQHGTDFEPIEGFIACFVSLLCVGSVLLGVFAVLKCHALAGAASIILAGVVTAMFPENAAHYAFGESLNAVTNEYSGFFPGSLKTLFGTLLKPIAFLMGVPAADAAAVGHMLGIKLSVNEFIGYLELAKLVEAGAISAKGEIIATFALCGFANFSSIGIQIGGLAALAPERRKDLAQLGLRAMLGGAIVTCITGTIAGMVMK